MKILIVIFSIFITLHSNAQPGAGNSISDSANLKSRITGNIKQFTRWTDHLGDNYLVLTVTDELKSAAKKSTHGADCKGGCSDKEIYAYHFIGKDSLLWKLSDFEKSCSYENIVEFRNGATKITDLDKNGLAEIWIMYSTACTNNVSARTLKLIMYQGNKKYAIRGTSQPSKNMIDEKYGGKYNPDKEFESLPQAFKDYARNLWMKYLYDHS